MQKSKTNLTSRLVESLREMITDGQIAPGDKLPSENTLIAQHGVSRTVVREAILRLQAEGLIYTRRGAGSFALTPPRDESDSPSGKVPRTLQERRQLLEFRMGVECQGAAAAARRPSSAALADMDFALAAFRASGSNASQTMSCDYEFHLAVAKATANQYVIQALETLGPAMIAMPRQRFDQQSGELSPRLQQVAEEHEAIREAIASGDQLLAASSMRQHLANSIKRLERESGAHPKKFG
ncbi:FadR family transcriptional regulator [Glutamicibacter sp. JL.03c]|uniref:FadR/GntR family transcriptional regulator n=1 Tax=Glutamicibacter sp. JL.03c TaxID=2984842 RepID=UPI0021F7EEE4|nr:FadR/GntR family transcriptional regulator [Glutamicibacter sp. JL.03c]UYQ76988.1 FadR family transcriptional regulator [Glutamicibacter sp. JL.03c]